MKLSFAAIYMVVSGIIGVFFSTKLSRWAVEWNYKILGYRFHEAWYKWPFVVVGFCFIAMGILVAFEVPFLQKRGEEE